MEKSRNALQKIRTMKDLGIYNKFLKNSEDRIRELNRRYSFSEDYLMTQVRTIISRRLREYNYLSEVIDTSFIFSDTPEKQDFWNNIVEELLSEI
jgi:hypothetical protein|nr:MAG TPA: hypothetical protein [Caudoviricetes sp.]